MAYDFSKVNLLVVESSQEMFQLFKSVLEMLSIPDANVHSAYTGDEGFEKFCETNHDIVVTDWLDSPDHGISLTTKIRTDAQSPNKYVPIIMTAGSGHLNRVIRSRDAGVSEYLVKPFSAGSLATRIERVIEHPRQFVISDAYTGPDRRVRDVPFEGEDRRVTQPETVDVSPETSEPEETTEPMQSAAEG